MLLALFLNLVHHNLTHVHTLELGGERMKKIGKEKIERVAKLYNLLPLPLLSYNGLCLSLGVICICNLYLNVMQVMNNRPTRERRLHPLS